MTAEDIIKIAKYQHNIDTAITILSRYYDLMAIDCLCELSMRHQGKTVTFSPLMGTLTFYIGNEVLHETDDDYNRNGIAEFIEEVETSWSTYGNDVIPHAVIRMIDGKMVN